MKNVTTKFLKFFFSILIFVSSFLIVFGTMNLEESSSILMVSKGYNTIPYDEFDDKAEVAIATQNINADAIETYMGTITAYGPDCVGCIGITASGYKVAEVVDGEFKTLTTTYNDKEYGELRILAADNRKFPMGTVMRVSGSNIDGYITGIVLDTGGAMRNAWAKGDILIDLLFSTEYNGECDKFGRKRNVTFEVLRYSY